jgi:hypothetical protein
MFVNCLLIIRKLVFTPDRFEVSIAVKAVVRTTPYTDGGISPMSDLKP